METRAAKRRRTDSMEEIKLKPKMFDNNNEPVIIEEMDEVIETTKNQIKTELKTKVKTEKAVYKSPPVPELTAEEALDMKTLIKYFDGDKPEQFMEHCRKFMNDAFIHAVEQATIQQADTPVWHAMRLGRITASRIHQASRCKTKSGSLVDSIMGKRSGWSFAMQRGTDLEDKVFEVLKKDFPSENLRQCGIYLDPSVPHMAASPDGIADTFVVEIKCPFNAKTHAEYLTIETLNKKYYGQIQMQMHITKRKKALLGVADVNFERNKKVSKVWIEYDEEFVQEIIEDANEFWIEAVFPKLLRLRR